MELFFPESLFKELTGQLLTKHDLESAGLVLLRVANRGKRRRLLAYKIITPKSSDYLELTPTRVVLRPEFFVPWVGRVADECGGIVFVHSHPMSQGMPTFSPIDDSGEAALKTYIHNRAPHSHAVAMVVGPRGSHARMLGTDEDIPVARIGAFLNLETGDERFDVEVMDRQVLAFGVEGQRRISALVVAIVGLGGTGSIVAQQLAYLGVERFILIDPDRIEVSNINRVVGASRADVSKHKVDVARTMIRRIAPSAQVEAVSRDVLEASATDSLLAADIMFSCTDSHGSRALLNQVAYQYLIPCFDMGVAIAVKDGAVTHIAGRAQMLAPDLPCLACGNFLDPEAVRLDFLPEQIRVKEPYFSGAGVTQPAVITFNSIVASLATTMYLSAVTGVRSSVRLQLYDGIRGVVSSAVCEKIPTCVVCSSSHGALARGDEWPLPSRA